MREWMSVALFARPYFPPGAAEAPTDPVDRMNQMITGGLCVQVVRAAALCGLADHAAAGEVTASGVAADAGLDPDACARFLLAAAAVGLLEPVDATGSAYRGTELLDTLRTDREGSQRDVAIFVADELLARPWGRLPEALRTGRDQAPDVLGVPFFAHLGSRPDDAERFTRGMRALTWGTAEPIAAALPVGDARTIVDVGGADGTLLRAVLRAHPQVTGTVFDLPHVVPAAVEATERDGLADRMGVVAGDVFADEVPAADLCMLKWIVHDWSDDEAVAILSRCRDAVAPGGRVAVVEHVLDTEGGFGPLLDLTMLVAFTGRERTLDGFRELFARAGLTLDAVTATGTELSVLTGSVIGG